MSQDIRKTGLLAQADEAQAQDAARDAVGRSNALVNIGLALSALLSVLYITLALGPGLDVPAPFNYVLAVFVGIVSIVPAELAIYIWRARLQGDVNITGAQRAIAAVCMVLAGISAAVTTMSFFGWALASLFPAFWLDAQPVANLGAILGAWLVFILGSIGYDTTSVTTRLNLQMANAMNRIHRTRANLIKSAAQAIGNETDTLVSDMDAAHLFAIDAQAMIADLLGLDAGRASAVGQIAASRQTIPQPPEDADADGAPDWPRLIADMGLTEDDLRQAVAYGRQARQAVAYGRQARQAEDLAIGDLQREIDARQRREEAGAGGDTSPQLADFLRETGKTAEELRRMAQTYGITDPDKAYRALGRFGYLPDGLARSDFDRLFDELMHGKPARPTTRPTPNGHGRA